MNPIVNPAIRKAASLALAVAFVSAGCVKTTSTSTGAVDARHAAAEVPKPGPKRVSIEGGTWAFSGDENRWSSEQFLQAARAVPAGHVEKLDKLVTTWPDVADDVLREGVGSPLADVALLRRIARSYDRIQRVPDVAVGWTAAFDAIAARPDAFAPFHQTRSVLLGQITGGQAESSRAGTLQSALPADSPAAVAAEALRVDGIQLIIALRPQDAAARFEQAIELAEKGPRRERFELGLLRAEALRRVPDLRGSASAWSAAVSAGAGVTDPDLWERALLVRLPGVGWPAGLAVTQNPEPWAEAGPPDAASVLLPVGKMRLARSSLQSAILAFGRAQAETAGPLRRAYGQLYRAQCMIALGQSASAMPTLEALADFPDPRVAGQALVVMGDAWCRVLNDRAKGRALMRNGLDLPGADWPGKERFLANYALYSLLEGEEDEGVRRLRAAERIFETRREWDDLLDAMKDEASYFTQVGNSPEAASAQKRVNQVEAMSS